MANFWRFGTKKPYASPKKFFKIFRRNFEKKKNFQNSHFWLLTADFWDICMKLKMMNTHRVGRKSLGPYRPSKSSQKQSKSADMGQTGYAMKKGQFWLLTADFWDMCMKPKVMNTHRVGQKSLQPYRPSKSSQKQSKSANMGQKCYAMEKVAQISSRIILDIYESFWRECPEKCCSFMWAWSNL